MISEQIHPIPLALSRKQKGSSLVELLIAIGIFLTLGLGAFQWGLLYKAKNSANHASFMAARAGALNNADVTTMRLVFARAMVPEFAAKSASDVDVLAALAENSISAGTVRIRILNPTQEAFSDFASDIDGDGLAEEIRNIDLDLESTDIGSSSQINIQDANLLKVEFTYGAPMHVPLVGEMISTSLSFLRTHDAFELALLGDGRMPITTTSIVRMQTHIKNSSAVVSIAEGNGALEDKLGSGSPIQIAQIDRPDIFIEPGEHLCAPLL